MTSDLNWENHNRWFHNYIETDQSSIVLLSGEKLILANLSSWTEVKFAISSGYLIPLSIIKIIFLNWNVRNSKLNSFFFVFKSF